VAIHLIRYLSVLHLHNTQFRNVKFRHIKSTMSRYTLLSSVGIITPCIIILSGCNSVGPSKSFLQDRIKDQLPQYWEIKSLKVEKQENLGSNVEPLVSTRFKVIVQLKEDIYQTAGSIDGIPTKRQEGVSFVTKSESQGKEVEIYGVSKATQKSDSWSTNINFDENGTGNLGQPRTSFSGKVVLRNSQEETLFRNEVEEKIRVERNVMTSILNGENKLSGERLKTKNSLRFFVVKFDSFDTSSNKFSGQVEYPEANFVAKIEGLVSDITDITFKTTSVLKGDGHRVGSIFKLSLSDSLDRLEGKRIFIHTPEGIDDMPFADDFIKLFPPEKEEEEVVIYLR
jgi:hypothetical protein